MITPGLTVTTFTTKIGQTAVLRYAQVSDATDLMNFINPFSRELSFTRFNGEQVTLEEEQTYLEKEVAAMAAGNAVKLFCYVDQKLAGVCDVHRDLSLLTRKRHTGILGMIVGQEFRGQGLGENLIRTTIETAATEISGLKMVKLDCFANNVPALALYQKVGFVEVGRIPKALQYRDGLVDEVIMVKSL